MSAGKLLEFHLHLRVHAANLPERKFIFVRFFAVFSIRILVRGTFLFCSAAVCPSVRPGATLPRCCELRKCGRGPFAYDVCIEGEGGWLKSRHTDRLREWDSYKGEGVQKSQLFKDVICEQPLARGAWRRLQAEREASFTSAAAGQFPPTQGN